MTIVCIRSVHVNNLLGYVNKFFKIFLPVVKLFVLYNCAKDPKPGAEIMRELVSNRKSAYAIAVVIAALISLFSVWASAPDPVLSFAPTGTNQFLLTITNGVTYTNYQILWRPVFNDPLYPWAFSAVGTNGQTNFLVTPGSEPQAFFRAILGSDQDLDGVPDWLDANPNDPTIGILTITIDSPTNGMSFN
jgi:hypothetical protein